MKLADFVKGLKVGEYVKIETKGEKNCVLKFWRADDGKYGFALDFLDHYGEYEMAGELLDYIAKHFADCLEYDFEVYKSREELKSENAQLKKALKSACEIIDDCGVCSKCPANEFCENSSGTCAENIFDELMKEAAKND